MCHDDHDDIETKTKNRKVKVGPIETGTKRIEEPHAKGREGRYVRVSINTRIRPKLNVSDSVFLLNFHAIHSRNFRIKYFFVFNRSSNNLTTAAQNGNCSRPRRRRPVAYRKSYFLQRVSLAFFRGLKQTFLEKSRFY